MGNHSPIKPTGKSAAAGPLKEIDLLHSIWLELSHDLCPEELHHHDVVHFALEDLSQELKDGKRDEVLARIRQHLQDIQSRRAPHQ